MSPTPCMRCAHAPIAFRLRLYAEVDLRQVTPVALAEDGLCEGCLLAYRDWFKLYGQAPSVRSYPIT